MSEPLEPLAVIRQRCFTSGPTIDDVMALIAEVERLRRCPNCGAPGDGPPRGPCAGHGTRWATYD